MDIKDLENITSSFPIVIEHKGKLKELKKKIKREQRVLQSNINKHRFLNDLVGVGSNGDRLDEAIKKLFKEFGFDDVRIRPKKYGEEDLQVRFDNYLLLIEATGTKGRDAKETKSMQVMKWRPQRIKENPKLNVVCLLIVNHDNKNEYNLRSNPYNQRYVGISESNQIGITTTVQLLNAYILYNKGSITIKQFKDKICKDGLIEF